MCGLVLVLALGRLCHATERTHNLRRGVLLVLGVSLVVVVAFGFRCPGRHAALVIRGASILSGRPMGCPKCGMGMDETMKRSAT